MATARIDTGIISGAIKDYIGSIQDKIRIEKVILFGSAAKGHYSENSDIDLIIISRDFAKMGSIERLEFLSCARTGRSRKIAMDILGYTPREFHEMSKESAVVDEAALKDSKLAKNGKVVLKK